MMKYLLTKAGIKKKVVKKVVILMICVAMY